MKTEISFELSDYLSHEGIKEIVSNEIRSKAVEIVAKGKDNIERVVSNAAYHIVFKIIDDAFDGDLASHIKDKVDNLISEMELHYVLRNKDVWGQEQSIAQTFMDEAVRSNKEAIESKVSQAIYGIDIDSLRPSVEELIIETLSRKLQA